MPGPSKACMRRLGTRKRAFVQSRPPGKPRPLFFGVWVRGWGRLMASPSSFCRWRETAGPVPCVSGRSFEMPGKTSCHPRKDEG